MTRVNRHVIFVDAAMMVQKKKNGNWLDKGRQYNQSTYNTALLIYIVCLPRLT